MQPEIISNTIASWTVDPGKARASPLVKARSDGPRALIETGPFSWHSDLPPALGGENKAASPTAMLLGALSGCAVLSGAREAYALCRPPGHHARWRALVGRRPASRVGFVNEKKFTASGTQSAFQCVIANR
jgi:acetoin utilization deacetylase AcuC-like enzyme